MMPLPSTDPVSLFLVLAAMAVLPFAAMVVTSYTKIAVVLGLLQAAVWPVYVIYYALLLLGA